MFESHPELDGINLTEELRPASSPRMAFIAIAAAVVFITALAIIL